MTTVNDVALEVRECGEDGENWRCGPAGPRCSAATWNMDERYQHDLLPRRLVPVR